MLEDISHDIKGLVSTIRRYSLASVEIASKGFSVKTENASESKCSLVKYIHKE